MISINVIGDPAPKGSNRAMLRGGRAVFVPGGSKQNAAKLGSWKTALVDALGRESLRFPVGPVAVGMIFRLRYRAADLAKDGTIKPTAPRFVVVKPDVDKLCRSTLDAITASGVWSDDSQVAIMLAGKGYALPGDSTGATLLIGDAIGEVIHRWSTELLRDNERHGIAVMHAEQCKGVRAPRAKKIAVEDHTTDPGTF